MLKSGWKTSEFLGSIAAAVLVHIAGPEVAASVKVACTSVIAAFYAISRGLAKLRAGSPAA